MFQLWWPWVSHFQYLCLSSFICERGMLLLCCWVLGRRISWGSNNRYHLLSAYYMPCTMLSLALRSFLILPRAPSFLKSLTQQYFLPHSTYLLLPYYIIYLFYLFFIFFFQGLLPCMTPGGTIHCAFWVWPLPRIWMWLVGISQSCVM